MLAVVTDLLQHYTAARFGNALTWVRIPYSCSQITRRSRLAFHTLILGIGNTLLSDEGVGVHALRYLAEHHRLPPQVELLDGGTLSFTLAGPIARADGLIVVDAARLDAEPGAASRLDQAHDAAAMRGFDAAQL